MPSTVFKTALNITINNMHSLAILAPFPKACLPEELRLWRTLQWLRYPSRLAKNARSNQKQSGAMRSSQEQLEPARDSWKTPGGGRERASSDGRPGSGWERLRAARSDQREAGSGRRRLAEPGSELYRSIIEQLVIN